MYIELVYSFRPLLYMSNLQIYHFLFTCTELDSLERVKTITNKINIIRMLIFCLFMSIINGSPSKTVNNETILVLVKTLF